LLFAGMMLSCSSEKEWQNARVVYFDDFERNAIVLTGKNTYFTFIKAKPASEDLKTEILIPEEVKLIEGDNFAYVRMFFDEENYGMESWSFGKVLAGDTVRLAETRFQFKTCACKTAGAFFHGYFLVCGDSHLKIKTDNKNNIYNRLEIYQFVENHIATELPKEINTIEDLKLFLKNINN
jgi:hypothetical protein